MEPNQPSIVEKSESTSKNSEKISKKHLIGIIILSIIALAGVLFGVYGITDSNNKNTEISDYKSRLELLEKETGAEVIEQGDTIAITTDVTNNVENKVKSIVTKVYDGLSELDDHSIFFKTFGDGSIIKIPDTDIYTRSNQSYGVDSTYNISEINSSINQMLLSEAYPIVENVLSSNGYTLSHTLLYGSLFYNATDKIYCLVSEGSAPYSVGCSSENWITEEDKELVLALASSADSDYVNYISATIDSIKNSEVSPYQKIQAGLMGAAGLFYRTSPESEWKFFQGTQSIISCDEYTGDIAKAFAGEVCWDETASQQSTVQP